jgi:5-formyltetrahydrofolate cyclo-ligase
VVLADVDFALVPALAIDRDGYRLGYGAGYFDKLLAGRGPRPRCVTALPSEFVLERVPREPHDVAVDLAMSERGREAPAESRGREAPAESNFPPGAAP